MNLNQTLQQFILLGTLALTVAVGSYAAQAADTEGTAKLVATISGNGRGTLSPNYNGKTLNIGQYYTMRAIPAAGCIFSDWSAAGSSNALGGTTAALRFQMESNLQLTATFLDIKPPTVTITTKKSTGTNSVVEISGTAKDNVGVTSVWCQAGSSGWNLAATGNEYTNWTAFVILSEGQNTIEAYAEDAAGNRSKTNSVVLSDASTGLVAPEAVAGTTLQLVAASNQGAVLSFDQCSFSQADSNGVAIGVGIYTYTLSDVNTGQLVTVFTAPPTLASNALSFDVVMLTSNVITLSFTNGTSGTWTNLNTNSGTFVLSDASCTAPDSLSGLTLQGTNTATNVVYQFTNEYGDGTFTSTNTTGDSSGSYSYAQYSPGVALVTAGLTDAADLGTTNYILLNFLAGSNTYNIVSINSTNGKTTNTGTFTISGETSTAGYFAPLSLAGLTGAATGVSSGTRVSHTFSFGASTYGDFSAGTNHANKDVSDVGTYVYTRTGPKTAVIQTIDFAPPEEADTNDPVVLNFTSGHSATITTSGGHETITFSEAATTVPLSLVGKKMTGSSRGHPPGGFMFGDGTFTGNGDLSGVGGTYTYTPYGPMVAMVIMNFTVGNGDGTAPGTTWYMELWFSSATGGSLDYGDFPSAGVLNGVSTGTFILK
jgi:hypothetical protein